MDSKKFIEIKKPVEEVREIEEETKLETPKVEKIEAVKETSNPSENLTDEEKEFEKDMKETTGNTVELTGAVNPALGATEAVALGVGGKITESVGKLAGDEQAEGFGRVLKEGGKKPLEDAKDIGKKVGEDIKELFD